MDTGPEPELPTRDHGHAHGGHAHEDGHAHHEAGLWARLRHGLSELVGGHSHDSGDQIDDALEADTAGRRALLISLAGLGLTAAPQAVVVVLSGSVALLGDTLHNVADALTAVPLLIAFTLARRPATTRFTYGYGRAEDLAGLAVLTMISLSSVLAAWAAIDRLLNPRHIDHLAAVAVAGLIGFVGNEIVARYRIRVGHQIGSAALVADGLHARTDGFTSLAVLLGAAGVALGWRWADPVVGLAITIAILGVLRSAARVLGARLMDAVDPDVVAEARTTLLHTEGIDTVRELRLRWIGHTLRAEADVTVDPNLTLAAAHDVAHAAEAHLLRHLRRLSAATIHTSPAHHHATPAL
ncbi:cation transporter [Frankia sp. AgB1.9]|uniref:cation diffusion facilitator family transporter n=1 Tax=unclassified Frankia TaxID=2632575 RepID=UPI001933CCB6|nr:MULTISPECIES: cation diffusion facilitator family transporter [unclassified Frankia]MBL7487305.1 cation transporter [Frankia sp. AgW1.1]MBL7546312.1 cation transporter [Frankia sp. AgB1.9]MBL7618643.1 cation transporter [Frankia sp. AgB1.8]